MSPTILKAEDTTQPSREYVKRQGWGRYALAAGGAALIILAIGAFGVALFSHTSQLNLQLSTTLPTMLGLALIIAAFSGRRAPERIVLDESGLWLTDTGDTQQLGWNQITWASRDTVPLSGKPILVLFGNDGAILRKIPNVYDEFDALANAVLDTVKRQGHPQQSMVRLRKARREGWLCLLVGIGMLAVAVSVVVMALADRRDARDLANRSREGLATIEEKVVAPNGVTKRIHYRVDANRPDGSRPTQMNVEIDPMLWQLLRDGQKIPVIYVPDRPDVSKLIMGEIKDSADNSPNLMLPVGLGLGAFCLLLIGWGIISLRGVILEKNAATGRFAFRNLKVA